MGLLAYFGPETFLPLTSVIAGVAGVVLMFGRNSWRFVIERVRGLFQKSNTGQPVPTSTPAGTAGPMSRRARYLNRPTGTPLAQDAATSGEDD